ncbi:MAG: transglycosylase SLT domain-containing protein, partial [Cyclobacteriaceae bacterium]
MLAASTTVWSQPRVPSRMQFADITLKIKDDARREIQEDVNKLTKNPKFFNIYVQRARTYFPIIERIFREEGVPDDLKYLVIQESALISVAVSSADAVGFWQFKDFTAKEMGLRVDRIVDERKNI